MENTISFAVTTRALIVDKGELFMVKHSSDSTFYALPGGKLEVGENLVDGMARELLEETSIRPVVGKLLIINDWVGPSDHRVEFFFWIRNAADYRHADTAGASHGFEIASFTFGNPADPATTLLPSFVGKKFANIVKLGEDYPTELVRSFTEKK